MVQNFPQETRSIFSFPSLFRNQDVQSNFQYRQYMTSNAKQIMEKNRLNVSGFCTFQDGVNPFLPHHSDLKDMYLSRRNAITSKKTFRL